ncbi:uncharacterized protein LOC132195273 [Neocloeon triangulifer]|uniref:uncharacterized protein LOC132195273 n=1 Tax=Neocloeon triangulifer TaxID=2078957 RepID=UPI00286F1ACF|nr:uncharacterized protein LOC132195273 [Neocloeon triangulifer]XP_059473153.1 uncharacterized protein LOC132195273 [Neocloeon triangulifer]XP_059473154.1 uncharacterized protein LOC132195273 [Neocloeon triangulifer]
MMTADDVVADEQAHMESCLAFPRLLENFPGQFENMFVSDDFDSVTKFVNSLSIKEMFVLLFCHFGESSKCRFTESIYQLRKSYLEAFENCSRMAYVDFQHTISPNLNGFTAKTINTIKAGMFETLEGHTLSTLLVVSGQRIDLRRDYGKGELIRICCLSFYKSSSLTDLPSSNSDFKNMKLEESIPVIKNEFQGILKSLSQSIDDKFNFIEQSVLQKAKDDSTAALLRVKEAQHSRRPKRKVREEAELKKYFDSNRNDSPGYNRKRRRL